MQPGWLGGVLFLLLNILHLPNAVVATLSYLVGPGFAIGADTLISPWSYNISEIPAPSNSWRASHGAASMVLISIVVFLFAGAVLYTWTIAHDSRVIMQSYLAILAGIALISFLSSGALLTKAMGAVGVSPWQLTCGIELRVGRRSSGALSTAII